MLLLLSLLACSPAADPHQWFAEGTLVAVSAQSSGDAELTLRPTTLKRNGAGKTSSEWPALLGDKLSEDALTLRLPAPWPPEWPAGSVVRAEWGRDHTRPLVTWHGSSPADAKRNGDLPPAIANPDWRCDAGRPVEGGAVLPSGIEVPKDATAMTWRCVHTRAVATAELLSIATEDVERVASSWTGKLGGSNPVRLKTGSKVVRSEAPVGNKQATRLSADVDAWGESASLSGVVVDTGFGIVLAGALIASEPTPEMVQELEALVEKSLGG